MRAPSSPPTTSRTSRGCASSATAKSRSASRALQRRALSSCTDIAPDAWRFVADNNGRPRIAAPAGAPPLCFSVANTRGLVACAVSLARDVGLDVETWRDDVPALLVQRCFGPDERTALASLPTAAQPRRFVELWTLKEAYIKARGLGLSLPLERIGLALDDGPPRLVLDPSLGDDGASWQLALWSPTSSHAAALCVQSWRRSAAHHRFTVACALTPRVRSGFLQTASSFEEYS